MSRRNTYSNSSDVSNISRRPSFSNLSFLGSIGQAISDIFLESLGFNSSESNEIPSKYSGRNVLGDQNVDYHKEGDALLQRLNLDTNTIGDIKNRKVKGRKGDREYNSLDPIYKRPHSPATIYVGDRHAASDISLLRRFKITSVVNCTRPADTGELPNYCEGSHIRYYEFPIATWSYCLFPNKSREEWLEDKPPSQHELVKVRDFFQRMFHFVQEALERNESVLIHCLAGAHRAGSCGVSLLMYFLDIELSRAVFLAKLCRPIIDPIGSLPKVLMILNEEMKLRKKKNNLDDKVDDKKGESKKSSEKRRTSFDATPISVRRTNSYDHLNELKDQMNFSSGGSSLKLAPVFTSKKGSSKGNSRLTRRSIDISSLGFLKEEDNQMNKFRKAFESIESDIKLPNMSTTKTMPNISNTETVKLPPLRRTYSNKY